MERKERNLTKDDAKNDAGYFDPTFYGMMNAERKARNKVEDKYRKCVFICSPYSGDVKANILKARKYSRYAVKQHCIPFTPHLLYPQFLNDSVALEREIGLHCGRVMLSKCKEVWVFGDTISEGMNKEIRRAKWRNMPVRYFTEDLVEYRIVKQNGVNTPEMLV